MGVYGNYERKRRETGTTKEVWTDETEGLKRTDRIYKENRIIP
jgi:hypothetical protein